MPVRNRSRTPVKKPQPPSVEPPSVEPPSVEQKPFNTLRDKTPSASKAVSVAVCNVQEWLKGQEGLKTTSNVYNPPQQSTVRMESIIPKVALPEQIQVAIQKVRDDPTYGPNINITVAPHYETFASSFKPTNVRFITDESAMQETTVNCFIGAHSAAKGILTGIDGPFKTVPYSVLHVDFPIVPATTPPTPPPTPVQPLKSVLSYVLGNLLRQSLLGEPLIMALKKIIESDENLSIDDICELLNKACNQLRDIKENEVKLYLEFCESQLMKRIELQGEDACSGELAIPLDFKPVLRKFADIFLVRANYVQCRGIPLKSIVFSTGPSDTYNISWEFVDHSLKGTKELERQYAEFVKNVTYNITFNVRIGIPSVGVFVVDMSLDKKELHKMFKYPMFNENMFFIILPDFITFLQMYLCSEQFRTLMCRCIKKYSSTEYDARLEPYILASLQPGNIDARIFDKGCMSCREVVDVRQQPAQNLNLSLDFHGSENRRNCPLERECFTILPDIKQLIPGLDLSRSLIHATVSTHLSNVLTDSDVSAVLFDTQYGSLLGDSSQEVQPYDSQPRHFESPKALHDDVNLVIRRSDLESISNEKIESISQQILRDVKQFNQQIRSGDTSLGTVLSLVTRLATSFISGLGKKVGLAGGRSVINLRRHRKKTIHRRRKNKKYSKKYSKKQNKIIRKTRRLNKKYKIRKSTKK